MKIWQLEQKKNLQNLQISVIFSVMKNPLFRSKCVGWLLKKFDDL
jgi:hypothetical protein